MPKQYTVASTKELISLLEYNNPKKYLSSLDVESLFTNVPLSTTIDIILNYTYRHPVLSPPLIKEDLMKEILELCTTLCPFKTYDGRTFVQLDGVSMGCVLGPTFSNYYMGHIEEIIFGKKHLNPEKYYRYVDDILILHDNINTTNIIKSAFEKESILKFTCEKGRNNTINFLDISIKIDVNKNIYTTAVHTKETHEGDYMNFKSQCPTSYKTGVIKTLLHRAYLISSNWDNLHSEITRIRQNLINNNFPLCLVDKTINHFLNTKLNPKETNIEQKENISLFFCNQMTENYKQREKHLLNIVEKNIKCKQKNSKLRLHIFYKNTKIKDLLLSRKVEKAASSECDHVVYEYNCPHSGCRTTDTSYIGYTTNTLRKRAEQHYNNGAIKYHYESKHKTRPTFQNIIDNMKILKTFHKRDDLMLYEALLIKERKPIINLQTNNFTRTLKLF